VKGALNAVKYVLLGNKEVKNNQMEKNMTKDKMI
jgi:hypothetical protein